MDEAIRFLLRHGYAVMFLTVVAEQLGLPVPSVPVLLAMGALSGSGEFSLAIALPLAVAGCLVGGLSWYELGRRRGRRILKLLCRISLEPDFCIRRAEDVFSRRGPKVLLFSKFVPGLSLVAPPIAAMFRMRIRRFLAWDAAGSMLWAGAFIGAGFLFRVQIERSALPSAGGWGRRPVGRPAGFYIGWKYVNRRRFLRRLRVAHIGRKNSAEYGSGENLTVVVSGIRWNRRRPGEDPRRPSPASNSTGAITRFPAIRTWCSIAPVRTSHQRHDDLRLHRLGITRVRPLAGGFDAWLTGGFPLETKPATSAIFGAAPG
jgi:membrane protein DedA with SNARE-associated domain